MPSTYFSWHRSWYSLNYVSWKRRAEVVADLRRIYQSATLDEAEQRSGEFEAKWNDEYLPIGQSWRRNWTRLTPFFDYPPEIRKVTYTTNAIKSVNMSLRKLTENRGSFPSDSADSLYHSVRGTHSTGVTQTSFTQKFG